MPDPDGERIARLEQAHEDLEHRVDELAREHRADHHRLRGVEGVVAQMVTATKDARRAEERQYRRLGLQVQYGGLAMALAMVILAAVQIYATMHHH